MGHSRAFRRFCGWLALVAVLLWMPRLPADTVVVFNEIMYHPATDEPTLEWVELYNQNAVNVDLSAWRVANGIDYIFPNGTIITGGGYLVVAISPASLTAVSGATNVVGPFSGRLSNSGEQLELRDANGRLMDLVKYGTDGDWPPGADGGGASLAKRAPNLSSRWAANWTVSREIGGTPGAANFSAGPLLAPKTNQVALASVWRYEDGGVDLGMAWREPGYDDSQWPTGPALFYNEEAALPGPKNTPLAAGRNTYYFRSTLNLAGDPAAKVFSIRPIVDDGAVVYVNGLEVLRLNMPTGAVTYATQAAVAVGNAAFTGPFLIASTSFHAGPNTLAVELHQTTIVTNAGIRVIAASGYTVAWDGDEGDFFSASSPAPAPANDALASSGTEVLTTSNPDQAGLVIDGRYGNTSSWSPASNDFIPQIVLRFNRTLPIASVAWSRDNGDTTESACNGTCTDRSLGNFTFQYTLATNPTPALVNSGNPSNGWATIATVQYLSVQPGFTPYLRHRFNFASTNGGPLLATGVRLRPSVSNTIDEIEINPPAVPNFDAVFGLELATADILPPPPRLVFNELAGAADPAFSLEVLNAGETAADLGGVTIGRSGAGSASYTFPAQTLAPGGFVTRTQPQLGFSVSDQAKLFLYGPGKFILLDAATVRTTPVARHPDGTGAWLTPALLTPGASNLFSLHDEIVFNEIMYHHSPVDATPAVTTNQTVVGISGGWRYQDGGIDLGEAWRAPDYNDASWASGAGVFAFNNGSLPATVNTPLAAGRNTYYFRTRFPFAGGTSNVTLSLRFLADDGAVFYLNGAELWRQNMPVGPIHYGDSASSAVGDATYLGPLTLPATNLIQGDNVLAVEIHQITSATTSSGLVLTGGGLTLMEEGPLGGSAPMNLARQPGAAPFVIDSLAGFPIHDFSHLDDGIYGNPNSWIGNTGNPGYAGIRFAGLSTIDGIAFGRDNTGTFSDRTLGLYTLQYTRVADPGTTTTVTGNADTGWATVGTLNYQSAGSGLFANPSRRHRYHFDAVQATGIRLLVPGTGLGAGTCIDELEVNPPDTAGDIVFGAELAVVTTLAPALPFTKSDEEWIEIYNRGTAPVALANWQLEGAIQFKFPAGTLLLPGNYLVVANNGAALRAQWPEVAGVILGDFTGKISDGETLRLRDAAGNPANQLILHARGWSDGGGSSLELTDARADNSNPDFWADSDESSRSTWQQVRYRIVAGQRYGSAFWNEFRIGMLDAGEVLVDDVSVVRDPDGTRQELIQNGNFESTPIHWRMLGDHRDSAIIGDPDDPSNHVLKISATSPARTSHNHIESSFVGNTALVDGQLYEVSYRARWLAGSPQLDTTGYFQKLAKATILTMPLRHGTPGAPNSRRVPNAGPALAELRHFPIVPPTNGTVTISVRAQDPDGVASVSLHYRVNPALGFVDLSMVLQPEGTWTAEIPAQGAGKIVQFYVSAQDALGATSLAPSGGPDSRALYQVADTQGSLLPAHELRLIQLDADRDFLLNATNVMSQQRLGGTVVYDRAEVFYDAGVRLHGSAAGRARDGDDYISYDISFPPDHLFRGGQESVGVDRSGRAPAVRHQDEIYILHMFHRAGLPCYYADLCYFIAPKVSHSGTVMLQLGAYNGLFVDEQFNTEGSVFNFDGTYEPSTTVGGNYEGIKLPVPLQSQLFTDLTDLGNDLEQYRSPFDIRHGERRDDFSGVIRLCQTMALPQAQFDAQIAAALDVNEAMRLTALTILCGIGDIYFSSVPSLAHNSRIFTRVDGGPAQFLPWDMDFVFLVDSSASVLPTPGSNLSKLVNSPANRRLYLAQVSDLCQNVFNAAYMSPWLAHYGSVVGQNYTGGSAYLQNRRSAALNQLPAAVPFAITSNGGKDFLTNTSLATIAGSGWLDVAQIRSGGGAPLAVTWTSVTNWQVTVPLTLGTNLLTFLAYDRSGNLLASQHITVTTSAAGGGVDTDGDGMPDAWELANGLNPLVNDADEDRDGDGISNLREFLSGTNPSDARSYLAIQAFNDAGAVRLTFAAAAGRAYAVLYRDQAGAGAWLPFANVPARATNAVVAIVVPAPLPAAQGFYRLVTLPPP